VAKRSGDTALACREGVTDMKRYNYSQARKRVSEVLDTAWTEEVIITRHGGDAFRAY
jgi:hypothetical protein